MKKSKICRFFVFLAHNLANFRQNCNLIKKYSLVPILDKMTSQKQQNSNLKPCTASQDLCPNLFLADFYSWFWTFFKLSENRKKDLSAPQTKESDYKCFFFTIKANAEFVRSFERHKIILKVAIENLKSRHFLTLYMVLNMVLILHAYLKTTRMVVLIFFIQIPSNCIDLWSFVVIAYD